MADLTKDLHSEHMVINMGPSHPATHGTVKFLLTLDGETIVNFDCEIGYLHRGFEKMCENSTWTQVFPYTDRLNYNSSIMNNVGYALTVEKLLGITTPERCQYIRVMASELSRLADHLTNVGAAGLELGAFSVFLYFVEARELVWDLLEELCGARLTSNYIRIGGLKNDMPKNFKARVEEVFKLIDPLYVDVDKLLTKNRIFIDRVKDTGRMSAEEAISYGFTGPCLRACGVDYDVRKAQPYLVYDRMDFEVPLGSVGDNFDKYLVRMVEIRQSMKIVEQCLREIPEGPINVENFSIARPPKSAMYSGMEELIHQFKTVTEGIKVPAGEAYQAIEAANGELGFYLVSDGTGKPWKCRVRPPSFYLTQGMKRMVEGALLADIIPTFDLINMIGGECDR